MEKKSPTSWKIGLGIILYTVGIFILSIYIDQAGILEKAPIFFVHNPIENVFFSIMWASLLLSVVIQLFKEKNATYEWQGIALLFTYVIGFAWFGVYFFLVLLIVALFTPLKFNGASNGT